MLRKNINEIKQEQVAMRRHLQEQMEELEIESFILDSFERNYDLLTAESGNRLTPDVKEAALKQVLMYWRKMKHVAKTITDTEVKLSLPNQRTSNNTPFTIEGVVDIVRDNDQVTMYDIKTHDYEHVISNKESYQRQLNVYAHIWQTLRSQELDYTAVICTSFPERVKEAVMMGDESLIDNELQRWNPEIPIPFEQDGVEETIAEFKAVVEMIENGEFSPPPLQVLTSKVPGSSTLFVTRVCRNCDARFSCDAYRAYTRTTDVRRSDVFTILNDYGTELEQTNWMDANLSVMPPDNIDDLI